MKHSSFVGFLTLFVFLAVPIFAFADEPTIAGAVDITAEATSSVGAYVTFSVTAADTDTTPLTPVCSPLSGVLFALGTTTVTCTATSALDAASSTTETFDIGVVDTTPPVFSAPSHSIIASSTLTTIPSSAYPTATDAVDGSITPTYTLQQTGPHAVHVDWNAVDTAGNSSTFGSDITTMDPAGITVSDDCTVTDSNGDSHVFAQTNTFLGICALQAAKDAGAVSDFVLTNDPGLGLYVQSVNGISAGATEYWALWQNEGYTSCGLGCLPVAQDDTLSLVLTDWMANTEGTGIAFSIDSLTATSSVPAPSNSGGGGTGGLTHYPLNISSALSYLASKQNGDGSFSSSLLTDWAALAFAAGDPGAAKTNLRDYLLSARPQLSSVTDYERHAMALEALGINPYSGTSVDYITPIVSAFDGTQIGDPNLDNDDIFAVFPLLRAGYGPSDTIIQKVAAFILSAQRPDGSWDGSADMTAAAAQAVGLFFGTPGIKSSTLGQSLGKAQAYLVLTQQADASWGSVDSTSWVQTMINSTYEGDPTRAIPYTSSGGYIPGDAIARAQQSDGGVRPTTDSVDNRVWSTSYAVTAASGKSWLALLQPFSRPSATGITSSGGGVSETAATSTVSTSSLQAATSTQAIATTTPVVATSTPIEPTVSTSTPGVASSTTSTAKPPVQKIVPKKTVAKKITAAPATTTPSSTTGNQTAAAANVDSGLLKKVLYSISSFFAWLF
ncbi:hypothetical protein A3D71_03060 [Candidatus Kaiserbacteria bacterium RIFCSPHIGHO2_02_FULL_55_20]|uniref:HYR domain-containing protein n=1 Tax=Candidatus Kaiserbacteria bacterium RIFCSPHIGHO2_02_FULL_55_20 TaxID=1798497 RepID=A0A1F6DY67_9BACT|nr:MAG: hypothetical protein A2680_00695 [Candidatus Kaiserbacteria bacterium RIFCSPHIGHO2_01_FULL_55_37]OGG66230.1 MAG: hypothetical protein A3D71_03060 [Candidatus Kaiserbacteria bacterium RIFCSPHIGHO2_02_FULL_55_20]